RAATNSFGSTTTAIPEKKTPSRSKGVICFTKNQVSPIQLSRSSFENHLKDRKTVSPTMGAHARSWVVYFQFQEDISSGATRTAISKMKSLALWLCSFSPKVFMGLRSIPFLSYAKDIIKPTSTDRSTAEKARATPRSYPRIFAV